MKSYTSRLTFESKLPEFEGVKFTITKLTEGRRIKLRQEIWPAIIRTAELQDLMRPHQETSKAFEEQMAGMSDDEKQQARKDPAYLEAVKELSTSLAEMLKIDHEQVRPAYFRTCFVKVEGLEVNGTKPEKVSADLMMMDGPPELVNEITDRILLEAGVTVQEKASLESPTTSDAEAGGPTNDITASPVSGTDTTSSVTVVSTSPATLTPTGETGGSQTTPPNAELVTASMA